LGGSDQGNSASFNYWFANFNREAAEEEKREEEGASSSSGSASRSHSLSESDRRSEGSRTSGTHGTGTFMSIIGKNKNIGDKFKPFIMKLESSDQHAFMIVPCYSINYDYLLYAKRLVEELKEFLGELRDGNVYGTIKTVKARIKSVIKVIELIKEFLTGQVMYNPKYDVIVGAKTAA
jgi:hypothetical protein